MTSNGILIVDDNPTNLKLARLVLEGADFDVRTACNAAEARAVLGSFTPRLILMDLNMPRFNGLELTRELRNDSRYDSIWIVALTAYAMPGDTERAYAVGCDGYVTKPIDTDELPQTVASFVARSRITTRGA